MHFRFPRHHVDISGSDVTELLAINIALESLTISQKKRMAVSWRYRGKSGLMGAFYPHTTIVAAIMDNLSIHRLL